MAVSVVVLAGLVAAPAALAGGMAGGGFNYNPGTQLVNLTVKNNSTGTNGTSVDFTLPAGTAFNGTPFESSGGMCTTTGTQMGSCTFGQQLAPGQVTSVGINTNGSKPASVAATEHFADGGSASVTATECGSVGATPASLPDGTVGQAYSQQFTGTGGAQPFTFAFQGTLPPGLTLSQSGLLSSTPTAGGSYSFQVIPVDYNGCSPWGTPSPSYTVKINDAPCPETPPLEVAVLHEHVGGVPETFGFDFRAMNGKRPYTYSASLVLGSGQRLSLPDDMTLSNVVSTLGSSTVRWTPHLHDALLVAGAKIEVTVTDAAGCMATEEVAFSSHLFAQGRVTATGDGSTTTAGCPPGKTACDYLLLLLGETGKKGSSDRLARDARATGSTQIGTIRGTVAAGKKGKLSIRLNKAGTRLLKKRHKLKVVVVGILTQGQQRTPIRGKLTLRLSGH